jgi:hypothetical protein
MLTDSIRLYKLSIVEGESYRIAQGIKENKETHYDNSRTKKEE